MHKGARFLRKLEQVNAEKRLEFRFLGNVVGEFRDLEVNTDPAERGRFNERVREIETSFIGTFSIWPEIYCHTLTGPWWPGFPCWHPQIRNSGTWEPRA